ncbi:4a-hydroxytetrahydrobiopterin dehydratase [Candidatus Woesearchaeota archaeon]|nr:4a-hydroxytetrahydrobiopterin dehydratase [Candidatus Woesearchaeota archaeon]
MKLEQKTCKPCEGGVKPLSGKTLELYLQEIKVWKVIDNHIEKEFKFKDFKTALDFVNKVGQLAEKEGHHPDIYLSWGKVKITLWTHAIDGLSENDFILAKKIDLIK